ncbi:Fe-S cluster assembly protein HesB [Nocardioides dilutus]
MLSITPRALAVLRRVTAHPKLTPTSGLRIAPHEAPSRPMQVRAVSGPHPDDRVLEQDGARLYLGRGADVQVEGRELDAVTDDEGRVQFILRSA